MAEERTPRESETRENDSYHPSDDWVPASILPSPNPQPGWTFRWIRTDILGQSDNTNVSRSFREGWQPCKVDDHPELQIMSDIGSRFEGNVHFGGLLLCKAPEEKMKARTRHYQEVDKHYKWNLLIIITCVENDPRMPMMKPERNTRTNFW